MKLFTTNSLHHPKKTIAIFLRLLIIIQIIKKYGDYKLKNKKRAEQPLLFKIIMFFSGLILSLLITGITIQGLTVPTESMSPAIKKNDIVIINKLSLPEKNEIAAIKSPIEDDRVIISRIIASEFDTVEIRNKTVYINSKKSVFHENLRKSKKTFPMKFSYRDNMPPVKLGSKEYFVISDNFDRSYDSRTFGKVNEKMIIGKVVYIYKK